MIVTAGAGVLYGLLAGLSAVGMVVAFVVFRRRDANTEFEVEALPEPGRAVA